MKAPRPTTRIWILFAGMATLLLPAARCGQSSHVNSPAIQGSGIEGSGPSSGVTVKAGAGANWSYGSQAPTPWSGALLNNINAYRVNRGLERLTWHDGMAEAARLNSIDMQTRSFFSIVNPDGVDLYQRMVSSNPRIDFDNAWAFVAEYQSSGFANAANEVFQAMLENTVTRALIESSRPTHVGFVGNATTNRVTLIFGQNVRPQY